MILLLMLFAVYVTLWPPKWWLHFWQAVFATKGGKHARGRS